MIWNFFTTPTGIAVIAAGSSFAAGLLGASISTWTTRTTHKEKLNADRDLAERKFEFDKDLAERKFEYDRELHNHKRRVELAETVLAEFVQMEYVIGIIRDPLPCVEEGAIRYKITLDRIVENREFISAFKSKEYRSRAILGSSIRKAYSDIAYIIRTIGDSARTLMNMSKDEERWRGTAGWQVCEQDIWDFKTEPDRLGECLKSAVATVEGICKPILEGGLQV